MVAWLHQERAGASPAPSSSPACVLGAVKAGVSAPRFAGLVKETEDPALVMKLETRKGVHAAKFDIIQR